MDLPQAPQTYNEFVARFPDVAKAWEQIGMAGRDAGPLTPREVRLVKLGLAVGAQREGATRAAARFARAMGLSSEEVEQVAALSASTLGVPAAVAAWTWLREPQTDA